MPHQQSSTMSQKLWKRPIAGALVILPSVFLLGCGECSFLEVANMAANLVDDFCSSELGGIIGDFDVEKSRRTVSRVGSKAQAAYTAACESAPIVAGLSDYLGNEMDCKDAHVQVYMACVPQSGELANNDITKSGRGWKDLLDSIDGVGGTMALGDETELFSDENTRVTSIPVTPPFQANVAGARIDGSENWWSCNYPGMVECNGACCCIGILVFNGDEACLPPPQFESCPYGTLWSASSIERTGEVMGKVVEENGQILDLLAVGTITSEEMQVLMAQIQLCWASPPTLYALYDDQHEDDFMVKCWVNLVSSSEWSSSTLEAAPSSTMAFLGLLAFVGNGRF